MNKDGQVRCVLKKISSDENASVYKINQTRIKIKESIFLFKKPQKVPKSKRLSTEKRFLFHNEMIGQVITEFFN